MHPIHDITSKPFANLREILKRSRVSRQTVAALMAVGLGIALFDVINPLFVMAALDVLGEHADATAFTARWHAVLWYTGGFVLSAAIQYGGRCYYARREVPLTVQFTSTLRQEVLRDVHRNRHLLSAEADTGQFLTTLSVDMEVLSEFFSLLISEFPFNLTTIVGVLAASCYVHLGLALGALAAFSLWGGILLLVSLRGWRLQAALGDTRAGLVSTMHDSLANSALIRSAGISAIEQERFTSEEQDHNAQSHDAALQHALASPLFGLSEYVGIVYVLLAGGYCVLTQSLSIGQLVALLAYMEMVAEPAARLGYFFQRTQSASTSAGRVCRLLEKDALQAKPLLAPARVDTITFKQVTYRYPNQLRTALSEISFTATKGDVIAIVGPNGAGKSSLVNLLQGWISWSDGSIQVNELSLKDIQDQSWIERVGVMTQQVLLFNRSIAENIGLRGESVSAIESAARAVGLHERILRLPQGYQSPVGEHGTHLSGGERQRIALARLFLLNPEVLVLDEPTAALDAASELAIENEIKTLLPGRITFLISHRPLLLAMATKVLLMDGGRLLFYGSPSAVTEQFPEFKPLFPIAWYGLRPDAVGAL